MRVIDVSAPEKLKRITGLSYGASRAGKTRFAGSWPRPLFLSDATESGWTTLGNMDRNNRFEADRDPIVWAIETSTDMMRALREAAPLIAKGDVKTIVIDSLTFYCDLYFNYLESLKGGRQTDGRQLHGKLASHLKTFREQVHLLQTNVLWLCLEKPPSEDNPLGGPMLSGQNSAKFMAGCDYTFYHRCYQQNSQSPLQWEIRTKKWNSYQAGGRDEGRLSDPLGYITVDENEKDIFVPDCTYRTLAENLGIIDTALVDMDPTGSSLVSAALPDNDPSANAQPNQAPPPSATANGKSASKTRPNPPAQPAATTAQPGRPTTR